jgi:hypothetical protein
MKKIPRRKSRPRSLPLASYAARNVFEPEVALFCRDVDGDDEEDGGMCSACLRQTTRPGNEDGAIISVDVKSGEFDNPRRGGRGRGGEGSGGGGEKKGGRGQRFAQGPRTNLFARSLPVPRFGTPPRVSAPTNPTTLPRR